MKKDERAEKSKRTIRDLQQLQSLPLPVKTEMTKRRIKEFVEEFGTDGVYISFSGGKDSTVLLDISRKLYPNIKAVFVDIPIQYPELKKFVRTFENVDIVKPKISFAQVCEKYGFPIISKEVANCVSGARKYQQQKSVDSSLCKGSESRLRRLNGELTDSKGNYSLFNQEKYNFFLDAPFEISDLCCDEMKKKPIHEYEKQTGKKPFIATMASESFIRTRRWLRDGCNAFNAKRPHSNPMSFWTEQDVLLYIKENNLPICSVYGEVVTDYESMGQCENQMSFSYEMVKEIPLLKTTGCQRTGCVMCGFGCHLEKESRFLRLKETNPKFYNLIHVLKNNGITYAEAIDWINEQGGFNIRY